MNKRRPNNYYHIGIDMGFEGGDRTCYTIWRRPNFFERLLRKLHLSRAVWEWEVVSTRYDPPTEAS